MSYTKFSKAVTKWLKANGLPCYGTAYDSPEETKARLDAWMRGSKEILRQWITDKRYCELISCAHGGWYQSESSRTRCAETALFKSCGTSFMNEEKPAVIRALC